MNARPAGWPASPAAQWVGLLTALAFVVALGWQDDGFWFLGDAARHASTGLFFAELARELPRDPMAFALSYYAHYPVIVPLMYPPAFHMLEGLAFLVLPPSPWVAKGLVLGSAGLLAAYTWAWGRRWLAPQAGWAGALLLLMPGVALYANGVLLNVPSTALGLAALYHLRRRLEAGRRVDAAAFVGYSMAAFLTYYPALLGLAVALAWTAAARRWRVLVGVLLVLAILTAATASLSGVFPAHLSRNLPSGALLWSPERWFYYGQAGVRLVGWPLLLGALAGLLAAARQPALRAEAARLALGLLVILIGLVPLPARDERYALLATPLLALSAMLLPMALTLQHDGRWRVPPLLRHPAFGLVALLGLALPGLAGTAVPTVTGYDQVAAYLARQSAADSVLYEGRHEALLGFFLRGADPGLQHRLVLADQLLYQLPQGPGFDRREIVVSDTPVAVLQALRERSGARWIVVDVRIASLMNSTARQLQQILQGPEFDRVASFPVRSPTTVRVDVYRTRYEPSPVAPRALRFPSLTDRVFSPVVRAP